MSERFHTPPHPLSIESTVPLIFLAGPVQGAPDWQTPVFQELTTLRSDVHVASPRRLPEDEKTLFTKIDSRVQVEWEDATLERSARLGSVVIWFAAQDHNLPYKEGRAYAQTTRLELGEAWGWLSMEHEFPLIVGIDPDYTNQGGGSESYIRLKQSIKGLPVYTSLTDVIAHAAQETPSTS